VSKDYNVFELQKAIGHHDIVKATRSLLPMVLGSLYNYFSKVFCLLEMQRKGRSKQEIMKELGLRFDFFLADYQASARNFKGGRIVEVFALLKEYDLKSKGVDSNLAGKGENELLKELVWRMMHMQ